MSYSSNAQYTAYSFLSQEVYFAMQLLKNLDEDIVISMESIGDIGIEGVTNQIVELKNSQSNRNPLSNRSTDLWKTLDNWTIFFYENKQYDISSFRFILFVNTENEIHLDIAQTMHNCNSSTDCEEIIRDIKENLLKVNRLPRHHLESIDKSKLNWETYVKMLLSRELLSTFKRVIINMEIEVEERDYLNLIQSQLAAYYGKDNPVVIQNIMYKYLGWVKARIQEMLSKDEVVRIDSTAASKFIGQIVSENFSDRRYISLEDLEPNVDEIGTEISTKPPLLIAITVNRLREVICKSSLYIFKVKLTKEKLGGKRYD